MQHPNFCLGRLIVEISRSHTVRHAYPLRLLWTSDQSVAEAATCRAHNEHKRQTSMSSLGLKPALSAIERLQTYALDHTATGTG